MNRVRDYQALEREYLSGTMSLRELCRTHGVTAHSAVMVQARQGGWAEKRRAYLARASTKYIELRADRAAIREAEVRDHAIEAIDEAITKFRSDLRATKRVVLADGSVADEPLMLITPRDLAMMIDRLQILFGRPALITEGRSFAATITSEALPLEALQKIVELTRGLRPPADHTSGLPHIREKLPD
jgi:transposase-like protein